MVSEVLARLPLFADLPAEEITRAGAAMRRRRYAKGSLIHAAGAMGADLYVIASGRVIIQLPSERGEELTLRLLWRGDFFGEVSLLDDEPLYGDAIAFDACELLLLGKREFLALLDAQPSVNRRLLAIVCGRLRHNARFARDLAFLNVPTRLARALVTLVESGGWGWTGDEPAHDARLVEITQSALAAHVGATRESVNKWLGYYERCGYLSRERDRIAVLRLDELRARAGAG
jgi:CRP/FNR family transcriptional regulator, cyclic AMP receptor protein